MSPHTTSPHGRHRRRPMRAAGLLATLVTILASVFTLGTGVAFADAGHGVGLPNITTNGFTHPWQGGWATDVGTAWCIDSGSWDPRSVGNTQVGDIPASRGVSAKNRNALAYALWAYGGTTDPTTAAGLATVIHGLSGDAYASTDVPSMTVSDANVKASAVSIYNEAESRAAWAAGGWTVNVSLDFHGGAGWFSTIKVTASDGSPIVGKRVTVVPYNVVGSQSPGVARTALTDAAGEIHSAWTQGNTSSAITVDATTDAPGYYKVWQGSAYAEGPAAQLVVTGTGTRYSGSGHDVIPSGTAWVQKTTTNPAYQAAVGATFDVRPAGGGTSLGTLTVGADGNTNTISLPVGTYQLVETSAPAGVQVDQAPHTFTVTQGLLTTVKLSDEVSRRAEMDLTKVDSATGAPVAGARLHVEYDSNNDGTYDTDEGTYTTAATPLKVTGLTAGNYRVTETTPPPGYLPPKVATKDVTLQWDQTTAVAFSDHLIPSITTRTNLVDTTGKPVSSTSVPAGLVGQSNVVGPIGSGLRDTATVTGLAAGEKASITSDLYGPATPGLALVCDDAHRVWSGTWTVNGSGDSTSGTFTPTKAGLYGYVETLDVPGVGSYSGSCGQITETAIFTPKIATTAQTPTLTSGATVTDLATVTGLATGSSATIDTALYGPFTSASALAKACDAGNLGTPVGEVHYTVSGSGDSTSPGIKLPAGDIVAGVYTFVETLTVPGWPGTFTHDCGTPPETFTVPHPPVVHTTSGAGGGASTNGQAVLPVTGTKAGILAGVGGLFLTAGLAALTLSDRRRRATCGR